MGDPGITKRNRASKRRGTSFEVLVRNFLSSMGLNAVRIARRGKEDIGDVVVITDDGHHWIIECKDVAKANWSGWIGEAEREAAAYAKHMGLDEECVHWVVIHKRRQKGVEHAYVVTSMAEWVRSL